MKKISMFLLSAMSFSIAAMEKESNGTNTKLFKFEQNTQSDVESVELKVAKENDQALIKPIKTPFIDTALVLARNFLPSTQTSAMASATEAEKAVIKTTGNLLKKLETAKNACAKNKKTAPIMQELEKHLQTSGLEVLGKLSGLGKTFFSLITASKDIKEASELADDVKKMQAMQTAMQSEKLHSKRAELMLAQKAVIKWQRHVLTKMRAKNRSSSSTINATSSNSSSSSTSK